MNRREFYTSPDQPLRRTVPRLSLREFEAYTAPFSDVHYEESLNRIVLGERLHELLSQMRDQHPTLVNRAERLTAKIEQGINDDPTRLSPDAKTFSNCYIVGYGMMQHAYEQNNTPMPQDASHRFWFDEPKEMTVSEVFTGMNMSQEYIAATYPDFPLALHSFLRTSRSTITPFARGMATLAAAEIYDSFLQIEAARAV